MTINNLATTWCLVAAILFTFCGGQAWRPQGRFGKRVPPQQLSFQENTITPNFGTLQVQEIPIENVLSPEVLKKAKIRPRLCSVSGIEGYPLCRSVSSSELEDLNDFLP